MEQYYGDGVVDWTPNGMRVPRWSFSKEPSEESHLTAALRRLRGT